MEKLKQLSCDPRFKVETGLAIKAARYDYENLSENDKAAIWDVINTILKHR